ncbi:MAG TPA: transcriptional repressor LexA [Syntrophorhabdaceae bacterium]|nr:transcriptional repressor LexA [Syntrophorhabdaceae bacterium]
MPRTTHTRETILDFIKTFRQENGYAPSVREVADHCGIRSPSVVQYHLNHLEQAGLIRKSKDTSRSVDIVGEIREAALVPLLGVIAAGQPIWVPPAEKRSAEAQRMIAIPSEVARGKKELYALKVRGNSMVDAMIADGDVVVMEEAGDVKSGDVVACWLEKEQEVTLKKIYFEDERIRLQPCNPYMVPMYHDPENVQVQGRVVAVLRMDL